MSAACHLKNRLFIAAVLIVLLFPLLSGCGQTASSGWDTDPDKLTGQLAESMRDLLIGGSFAPLPDGQLLPGERELPISGISWPGTGTLIGWYSGKVSFNELGACLEKGQKSLYKDCRQEKYTEVWWLSEDKLGYTTESMWEWILTVDLKKYKVSYVLMIVALDETGNKALAYADYHCSENCASGGILYTLEKRDDGWYTQGSRVIRAAAAEDENSRPTRRRTPTPTSGQPADQRDTPTPESK